MAPMKRPARITIPNTSEPERDGPWPGAHGAPPAAGTGPGGGPPASGDPSLKEIEGGGDGGQANRGPIAWEDMPLVEGGLGA